MERRHAPLNGNSRGERFEEGNQLFNHVTVILDELKVGKLRFKIEIKFRGFGEKQIKKIVFKNLLGKTNVSNVKS